MEYFEVLRLRQSNRKFTPEQISVQQLSDLLLSANAAPTGSNLYKDIHLTVVQDKEVLKKLSQASDKRREDTERMKQILGESALTRPRREPFCGAPTVIFVSHRKQDAQPGIEFANAMCVAYSMHLAATDLNLGSVLIWGIIEAMREIPELDNTALLNLPDNFEPLMGLAVGYSEAELTARDINPSKMTVNYIK